MVKAAKKKNGAEAAVQWYKENTQSYKSLADKVEGILKDSLEQSEIVYHGVTSRAKTIKKYEEKARQEKYSDPKKEIKDMAGIRVTTYLESDVRKVADIVEKLFEIDKENSLDQSNLLGSDRVGYRSVHYVATFDKKRCKLLEYKQYKGMPFEIQIRSLLQHAWAEIEHDRNYSFGGELPVELERRFHLVAGMLEVADREFVSLANEIDKYKDEVKEGLEKNEFDIELNSLSLKEYLSKRFATLIAKGRLVPEFGGEGTVVEELKRFGLERVSQLDDIVPSDWEESILATSYKSNFAGTSRHIMVINDAKKFFEDCWHGKIMGAPMNRLELFSKYDVDMEYVKKHVDFRDNPDMV